jgi:copper chaperone
MFAVPEMNSGRCSHFIQTALTQLDPAARMQADIEHRLLQLETTASDAQVLMILNELGFAANVRG